MTAGVDPIVVNLIMFVLAIFVGYHVVWSVTPALHTPLMSRDQRDLRRSSWSARCSPPGRPMFDWGGWVGVVAVALASINVFGGFLVTQRMLEMFRKKEPQGAPARRRT